MAPTLAKLLNEQGHHTRLEFCGATAMRQIMIKVEKAAHEQYKKSLPEKEKEKVGKFDPSTVQLPHVNEDARFLKSFSWAPKTTDPRTLPGLYITDAAHMIGKPGTMFSMWTYDANANACCIGVTFHLENESGDSWFDFFNFILNTFPSIDSPETILISDGDKGAANAFQRLFEHTHFLTCNRHRRQTVKTVSKKVHDKWYAAANARASQDYKEKRDKLIASLSREQAKRVLNLPPRNQFLVEALEYSGAITFGYSTSQLVESLNQSEKPSRMSHFVPAIIKIVLSVSSRFCESQEKVAEAKALGYELTPMAHKILSDLKREAEDLAPRVEAQTPQTSFVETTDATHQVNLQSMTCSCELPKIEGRPCVHVLCAASKNDLPDLSLFAHDYYTVERWNSQYPQEAKFDVVTLGALKEYVKHHGYTDSNDGKLQLPLMGPPKRGRPRDSTRICSSQEIVEKKTFSCSICKKRGHTAKSCSKRQRRCMSSR